LQTFFSCFSKVSWQPNICKHNVNSLWLYKHCQSPTWSQCNHQNQEININISPSNHPQIFFRFHQLYQCCPL
jgi:hypothetical protein